jgi:GT2 family glycosyltransferase
MISYHIPEGVRPIASSRPILSTAQNGKVALDEAMLELWRFADRRTLEDILANFHSPQATEYHIRTALACLAEAGLLERFADEDSSKIPEPSTLVSGNLVSVIILVYNGIDWLIECIPSLLRQTYTPIEVIIVDNASPKPCVDWVQSNYPQVKVLHLTEPHTIPAANNRGVALAQGQYYLLLNQDTILEPDAISEMVSVMESDPRCVAAAPKLRLLWAPKFLNGLGNRVESYSWGTDTGIGHLDLGQFDGWHELPSACTAAALFSKPGWNAVGPMDEKFPMYYDDPEWCYRARLYGYKILAAPKAVVYHAFGGRVPSGEPERLSPQKLGNALIGRLSFVFKLLYQYRSKFLRNYLLEDWLNFWYALTRGDYPGAKAYIRAEFKVLFSLLDLRRRHRLVQAQRVIPDQALFALQQGYPPPLMWNNLPELTWHLIETYYYSIIKAGDTIPMPEFSDYSPRPRLLIVSNDIIDNKMGGPGIRYLEMSRCLSHDIDVTLAVPQETTLQVPGIHLVRYWEDRPASLQVLVQNHDIALISGYMPLKFPFLAHTQTHLVVDLYDPFFLENLYYYLDQPIQVQETHNHLAIDMTNRLARLGDFFICGTERQRDFWLGLLAASARINPQTFANDPSLRKTIDVVGIGFPEREPQPHPVLRGVHPMVSQDAKIVLWGGGIWNWLDPLTLVNAWPKVISHHPDARLVFLGTRYPNPLVPDHKMALETVELAEKLGEKDKTILFIEWLPYADHEALLCEADIGVTFQPDHIETRYSIRSRVVTYFWTHLPSLISDGDITADWVRQYRVGRVVNPGDVEAVAKALVEMLAVNKEEWMPNFEPMREQFIWPNVVIPLRNYCLNAAYAPDRMQRAFNMPSPITVTPKKRNPFQHAIAIARQEGLGAMFRRTVRHMIWLMNRS